MEQAWRTASFGRGKGGAGVGYEQMRAWADGQSRVIMEQALAHRFFQEGEGQQPQVLAVNICAYAWGGHRRLNSVLDDC